MPKHEAVGASTGCAGGVALLAKARMRGQDIACALDGAIAERGRPIPITVDNSSEFAGRVMDAWAPRHGVRRASLRPGRPTENDVIESFNGRLRDERLNVELFASMADTARPLRAWRHDSNHQRPHSALAYATPAAFAAKRLEGSAPPRQIEPGEQAGLRECLTFAG